MVRQEQEPKQSPRTQPRESNPVEIGSSTSGGGNSSFLSPRFKSAAAMAGWDEESLLMASLIVDDTPEQDTKQKRRSVFRSKTSPPTNSSRRKRRVQRKSPVSIPMGVLDLDNVETTKEESVKEKVETEIVVVDEEKKRREDEKKGESSGASCSNTNLPCMDKLRDELSCAICLEICFEPSTTPCGHSFCMKCLRSAADKCGKRCPKCRQLMSNGRSCTVNTVLWNTIQLLFPQEVETRKAAGALTSREEDERKIPDKAFSTTSNSRNQSRRVSGRDLALRRRRIVLSQDEDEDEDDDPAPLAIRLQIREAQNQNRDPGTFTRPARISAAREIRPIRRVSSRDANPNRRVPNQDEDAALALRLQREEFLEAFRGTSDQSSASISSARANIRAMASRATNRGAATRFM